MVPDPRPLLAITIGDPAGIGPEVVLKALRHPEVYARSRPLVIGDRSALERAASWIDATAIVFDVVSDVDAGRYDADVVAMLDLQNAPPDGYAIGKVSSEAGRAAVEYVFRACDLALEGKVDAVVTAPLNKAAMHAAGFTFAGHTELLAERTGAERVSMLLIDPSLRVVHVSTHVALSEAIRRVTRKRVEEVIDIAQESCRMLGIGHPRIAVAGLNPHASKGGIFGDEKAREILPAIVAARANWNRCCCLTSDADGNRPGRLRQYSRCATPTFTWSGNPMHDQGTPCMGRTLPCTPRWGGRSKASPSMIAGYSVKSQIASLLGTSNRLAPPIP